MFTLSSQSQKWIFQTISHRTILQNITQQQRIEKKKDWIIGLLVSKGLHGGLSSTLRFPLQMHWSRRSQSWAQLPVLRGRIWMRVFSVEYHALNWHKDTGAGDSAAGWQGVFFLKKEKGDGDILRNWMVYKRWYFKLALNMKGEGCGSRL